MRVKDHFLSGEEFVLEPFPEIEGLLQTDPVPNDLEKYYNTNKYLSHNKGASLLGKVYGKVQLMNLRYKLKLVRGFHSQGHRLLDYGCGMGDFVDFMNENGFEAKGFEPNANALKAAKAKETTVFGDDSFLSQESFDIITLWHVLEHIPDFKAKLELIRNALEKTGLLVIAVPNHESFDARFYGSHWAAYDVPRHLWHFSPSSMGKVLDYAGFELIAKKPLYFDSFFVSLMSEKYLGTFLGALRAFFIGAISNIKGSKSQNFSSIVYIARRKK